MNTLFKIYGIYLQISKNKILSNLLLVIPVTPYNLYVCASIITYLYLPYTIHQIIKHIILLSIGQLIENIISSKYIQNKLLNDMIRWIDIIHKILTISYILSDLQLFKLQYENLDINIVYKNINLVVLDLAISSTYYAFIFGSITTFIFSMFYKITIIYKDKILELNEDLIQVYKRAIFEYIERPENNSLRMMVFAYFRTNESNQLNQTNLTIEQINEIAPLRCIGLANTENFESTSCSICLDNFNHTTLHRTLSCNHKFHPYCVDKWLFHSSTCPMCRKNVLTSVAVEVDE
jgi:hypothetical protein